MSLAFDVFQEFKLLNDVSDEHSLNACDIFVVNDISGVSLTEFKVKLEQP
jgi:hypothetical protein